MSVRYENLRAWRTGMRIARRTYRLTAGFPENERSGLTATIRKCAVSMPAELADAAGSGDPNTYAAALDKVSSAARELRTYIVLARRLRYLRWGQGAPLRRYLRRYGRQLASEAAALRRALAQIETHQASTSEPTAPAPPVFRFRGLSRAAA